MNRVVDPPVEPDLRRRLLWLMLLRAAIVTVLLGTAVLVEISVGDARSQPLFLLIGVTYALTAVYAATLKQVTRHRWLVDLQLAADALIVSAVVLITGGISSYFSSLYGLPIVAASILQFRRGGLLVALLSALCYAAIVIAQYQNVLGFVPAAWMVQTLLPPARVAGFTVSLNTFGLIAVGVLSGHLAEGLRRAGARLERASSEIADLQAFSQHVIDSLPSGLATIDTSGRILTFNRAAQLITGQPGSVIGRPVSEVLKLPPEFGTSLEPSLLGARRSRAEYVYVTSDGRRIEIGLTAAPLVTPAGLTGFLFAFQDVTETRRLEREARIQQRLAAVGEMAAGIAHEIRNPLASMSGSIQILREELPLSDEQAQLMDIVLRESERLNNTIRSFLAYARPQRFATARLDLRRVLSDTALLLRNSAECGEGHAIDVDVPAAEVWFEADEGQIKQIVWNLATNGLRAMPHGGHLRLATETERDPASPDGRGGVVLQVRDEGVGIAPEEVDGVFQPFRGAFAKGTGLGLAIVHRIVTDYGGTIHVASQPGAGTTVRIRFPVQPDSAVSAGADASASAPEMARN